MIGIKLKVFLLYFYCIEIDAARILAIFPMPAVSHQLLFRPLIQELARRGHDVTVITPHPAYPKGQTPANLTEIDVHNVTYNLWYQMTRNLNVERADTLSYIQKFMEIHGYLIDAQLHTLEVQEVLKKPKDYFDLLLLESCLPILIGMGYKFDAPIIQISSMGTFPIHYSILGSPMHPILYPTWYRQCIYNLTWWEKVVEYYKYAKLQVILHSAEKHNVKIMQKLFGNNLHDDIYLYKRVKLLFVNEHRIWLDNRPTSSNIQLIGGIHHIPGKVLPKDLQSYLDASENGTIYLSFGSTIKTSELSFDKIEMMNRVFRKLPYDVLIKWDDDELSGRPPNVRIQKWLPQSDLLKHPKIKLFITQAGLQSTDEAIDAAVPLLGIPLMVDQWYNAEKYVRHKIGLQLNYDTLNEVDFKNSIKTIINDKSYKRNMFKLRKLMRDFPVKPLDLAVWWTEHVIKYGGDHIAPPSAHMSWIEYYEIELILICLCILFAIVLLLFYLIRAVFMSMKKKTLNFNTKTKTN